jgi:hypothetical protein
MNLIKILLFLWVPSVLGATLSNAAGTSIDLPSSTDAEKETISKAVNTILQEKVPSLLYLSASRVVSNLVAILENETEGNIETITHWFGRLAQLPTDTHIAWAEMASYEQLARISSDEAVNAKASRLGISVSALRSILENIAYYKCKEDIGCRMQLICYYGKVDGEQLLTNPVGVKNPLAFLQEQSWLRFYLLFSFNRFYLVDTHNQDQLLADLIKINHLLNSPYVRTELKPFFHLLMAKIYFMKNDNESLTNANEEIRSALQKIPAKNLQIQELIPFFSSTYSTARLLAGDEEIDSHISVFERIIDSGSLDFYGFHQLFRDNHSFFSNPVLYEQTLVRLKQAGEYKKLKAIKSQQTQFLPHDPSALVGLESTIQELFEQREFNTIFQIAEAYEAQKRFSEAMQWLNALAHQNYRKAQKKVGDYYADGKGGVPCDNERAFSFYLSAAQAGEVSAKQILAEWYEQGKGTSKDMQQALQWYEDSLQDELSLPIIYKVTCFYAKGLYGIAKNLNKAIQWYRCVHKAPYNPIDTQNNTLYDKMIYKLVRIYAQAQEWTEVLQNIPYKIYNNFRPTGDRRDVIRGRINILRAQSIMKLILSGISASVNENWDLIFSSYADAHSYHTLAQSRHLNIHRRETIGPKALEDLFTIPDARKQYSRFVRQNFWLDLRWIPEKYDTIDCILL